MISGFLKIPWGSPLDRPPWEQVRTSCLSSGSITAFIFSFPSVHSSLLTESYLSGSCFHFLGNEHLSTVSGHPAGVFHLSLSSVSSVSAPSVSLPWGRALALQCPRAHLLPPSPALGHVPTEYSSLVPSPGREREQCAGLAFFSLHPFHALNKLLTVLPGRSRH